VHPEYTGKNVIFKSARVYCLQEGSCFCVVYSDGHKQCTDFASLYLQIISKLRAKRTPRTRLTYQLGTTAFDVLPAKNDRSLWRVTSGRASYDGVLLAERRTISCSPCTQPLIFSNLVATPVAPVGDGCVSSFCGYQSEMIQALTVAQSS
jgi:hypothetical protein